MLVCLHICLRTIYRLCLKRKSSLDPYHGLQMAVSHHVGTENQIWVLRREHPVLSTAEPLPQLLIPFSQSQTLLSLFRCPQSPWVVPWHYHNFPSVGTPFSFLMLMVVSTFIPLIVLKEACTDVFSAVHVCLPPMSVWGTMCVLSECVCDPS